MLKHHILKYHNKKLVVVFGIFSILTRSLIRTIQKSRESDFDTLAKNMVYAYKDNAFVFNYLTGRG